MVDETEMRRRVAEARVGRLGTVTPDGRPHVVACCFALDDSTLYSAIDGKPKSTLALRRLDNIRAQPDVTLLVDHYDDANWGTLWWVRVDGRARIVDAVEAEHDRALAHLAAKYEQYRIVPPPGAVIGIDITSWRAWEGTGLT